MTDGTSALPAGLPRRAPPAWLSCWPLILGFGAMALPTLMTLGREVWSREIGAHGPIVLTSGVWLLTTRLAALRAAARPAPALVQAALLLVSLPLYIFGHAYDFISIEAAGLYGVMIAIALGFFGWRAMAASWFPFFYLGFLVPPPGWVIDSITAPLRMFVSYVSTGLLQAAGIPIVREGVTMMVGGYQLLVEDACSGMNSLIGLVAISLLYIYLMHRASWRYALLLVAFVLPIAIMANVVRICILVLLTYFYGDAVAQGFLHLTAGMLLFLAALLLVFALDTLFQRLLRARGRRLAA